MANYVIKEMPTDMGNGKEGRQFPKMQVYSMFDYEKVVELVHVNSPAFSPATIRGVLDTLAVVLKSYLPLGHTMKIDNLGVFSLALEFADGDADVDDAEQAGEEAPARQHHHVRVKDVNFRVDQRLVDGINRENSFERTAGPSAPPTPSPYTPEERLQRALRHADRHGFITLQEYANLNQISYSTASRELARLVADPQSGIKAKGSGSHKVWVREV